MSIKTRLNKLEQQTGSQSFVVIVGKTVDGVFIPNEDNPKVPPGYDGLIIQIVDTYGG